MKASIFSGLAAAALIVVFGAIGAFTIWQIRQNDAHAGATEQARAVSEPLRDASEAAYTTELRTLLWLATGNQEHREGMLKAEADFEASLHRVGQSPVATDREFAGWAETHLVPMAMVLRRFGEEPAPPLDEILLELHETYVVLYDSIAAGDLGDQHVADTLVNPRAEGGTVPIKNPIAAVMAFQVARHEAEVEKLAATNRAGEQLFLRIAPALYSVGMALIVLLLVATLWFGRRQARTAAEIRQLRRMTTTDPLTQLGNRRGFEEATKRLCDAAGAGVASLIMMDLDEFKVVNDTFGHARGDLVLTNFAELLSHLAPPGASRFRIGGDEFGLILRGINGEDSLKLAETVRLTASTDLGNGVTVSAGVAVLDPDSRDESLLLQQADAALYEGKMRGRNLAVLYRNEGHAAPLFPATKLQAVRRLLQEGRIEPVFQPIWDLDTHSLLGYEGLSRPHEDYDLSGPQQAFEIAEQFGHAADLDALCRNHLLSAASDLPKETLLFLNLSPYSLTHQAFSPLTLIREIESAGIAKERVVFEITEKSDVAVEAIAEAVVALRLHGLSVAMDDVGAGNNGLSMLRKVPVDYVKIDRGVILAAAAGGTGRAALMAILAFASASGAVVIAEGIEDEGMFAVVRDVASQTILRGKPGLIHGVQGFLFGFPLPASHTARELPPELAA